MYTYLLPLILNTQDLNGTKVKTASSTSSPVDVSPSHSWCHTEKQSNEQLVL